MSRPPVLPDQMLNLQTSRDTADIHAESWLSGHMCDLDDEQASGIDSKPP